MKGVLLWLFVSVQDIFALPWLLELAHSKLFFSSPHTISMPLSPSPSKLGRQACWVTCLLVCVSGLMGGFKMLSFLHVFYYFNKKLSLGRQNRAFLNSLFMKIRPTPHTLKSSNSFSLSTKPYLRFSSDNCSQSTITPTKLT
jgi:hypothetical protein